jgi:hypothetical protein
VILNCYKCMQDMLVHLHMLCNNNVKMRRVAQYPTSDQPQGTAPERLWYSKSSTRCEHKGKLCMQGGFRFARVEGALVIGYRGKKAKRQTHQFLGHSDLDIAISSETAMEESNKKSDQQLGISVSYWSM